MTDKPRNQIEADTQPAYDPPQALRMGDIRAGTGGTGCNDGSVGGGACGTGTGAPAECAGDGNTAGYYCTTTGNSPVTSCVAGSAD